MKASCILVLFAFSSLVGQAQQRANLTLSDVFVTSFTTAGAFSADADFGCAFAAQAGGHPGIYRAWLSTSTSNASGRVPHTTGGYKLISQVFIANDWADLTDGTLLHAINVNEFGVQVPSGPVWTATNINGFLSGSSPCTDWTSSNANLSAIAGLSSSTASAWTNNGTLSCNSQARLYCFSEAYEVIGNITGRVAMANGRAIRNATLTLTSSALPSPQTTKSNYYGQYSFANLPSGVSYTLTVSQRRFSFTPPSREIFMSATGAPPADFVGNP